MIQLGFLSLFLSVPITSLSLFRLSSWVPPRSYLIFFQKSNKWRTLSDQKVNVHFFKPVLCFKKRVECLDTKLGNWLHEVSINQNFIINFLVRFVWKLFAKHCQARPKMMLKKVLPRKAECLLRNVPSMKHQNSSQLT